MYETSFVAIKSIGKLTKSLAGLQSLVIGLLGYWSFGYWSIVVE